MEKIRQTTPRSGLVAAPTQDANPVRMPRTVPKGKSGNGNSLPPSGNATYGLGVGTEVKRMSRSGGKGPGGSGMTLKADGPGTTSRKPTGGVSHQGRNYGVGGHTGGGSSGYGV